jgi:copper transport protein
LASGVVNSWYEVGTISNLVETPYGWLVLAKVGLFAAMVTLASVNRFYLTPRLATAGAVLRLQRNAMAESTLGFAAIAVVGFLGVMAPASHSQHHAAYGPVPADAAYVHIHSLAGMADVAIVPGHVGTARATIRLWNEDFQPVSAETVTLMLTMPVAGGQLIMRSALRDSDGDWQIDEIELPRPGNWTATVDAKLGTQRYLRLEAPIAIAPRQ